MSAAATSKPQASNGGGKKKKPTGDASADSGAINKVMKTIQAFQLLNAELPLQQAACLMYVAANQGCMMLDMANAVRMTQSAASRNIAALGKWARYGKPGLELIRTEEDPMERRRKLLYLTDKGKRAVAAIVETTR